MNNQNEKKSIQKIAIISYLKNLLQNIERDCLNEGDIEKIYNILYLHFSNCTLNEIDERKILDYTTIGWYLSFLTEQS